MNQSNNRSRYVPGALSPNSLFLAVAFFLALDFTAYWSARLLFRNQPQQKTQEADLEQKLSKFDQRLAGVERSTNALSSQVAAAKKEVSVVEQNVADLKKTTVPLEEIKRLKREIREKFSNSHAPP